MLETLPPFTPELFWTYAAVFLATALALVVVAWRKRPPPPPPATPANLEDWFDSLSSDEKRTLEKALQVVPEIHTRDARGKQFNI